MPVTTITVRNVNAEDEHIKAIVSGDGLFAIHPTLAAEQNDDVNINSFTITHVATGLAIKKGFPNRDAAIRFITGMRKLGLDWTSSNPDEIGRRNGPAMSTFIREYENSVVAG